MKPSIATMALRLMEAQDNAATLPPLSASDPSLDVPAAYRVLAEIEARRRAQGWRSVGRKIGFTNRTIWPHYGVYQPMWAHVWSHTVRFAPAARASLSLAGLVQPRIEPEVAFKLRGPVAETDDALEILQSVECMAPAFEIVQSHFPDWTFTAPDCTADGALHAALVIGPHVVITDANRASIAEMLPTFAVTLRRGDDVIDEGIGAHVLGSPALALEHLARVLRGQAEAQPLAAGEWITTGTLTDAWPVQAGETWRSDYGSLGLHGVTLSLT
jgi:2-oxo-3-hexenedioate decarboxylase